METRLRRKDVDKFSDNTIKACQLSGVSVRDWLARLLRFPAYLQVKSQEKIEHTLRLLPDDTQRHWAAQQGDLPYAAAELNPCSTWELDFFWTIPQMVFMFFRLLM
eukprot:TRINITY_DN31273_c0_g4_i1.p1 TRINITY_DN31273_c0_g4~~TRINITY_DN31273_c0_g4_i1.p1  ORF type:complete len:106 (+),score=24.43 TRINITY_DN31273_c0_g4_i1:308-625(+)